MIWFDPKADLKSRLAMMMMMNVFVAVESKSKRTLCCKNAITRPEYMRILMSIAFFLSELKMHYTCIEYVILLLSKI